MRLKNHYRKLLSTQHFKGTVYVKKKSNICMYVIENKQQEMFDLGDE